MDTSKELNEAVQGFRAQLGKTLKSSKERNERLEEIMKYSLFSLEPEIKNA